MLATTSEFPHMGNLSKHGRIGNMLATVTGKCLFSKDNKYKKKDSNQEDDLTLLKN